MARPGQCANTAGPLTNQRKDRFMAIENLSADRLRELLHYDSETGVFRWKLKASERIKIGEPAGGKLSNFGYNLS